MNLCESRCSLYDQIFKPSKLPGNADFHLFKAGVEPKWEDPECANGGKWTVTSSRKANLDTMWLETVIYFSLSFISLSKSCNCFGFCTRRIWEDLVFCNCNS